MQKQFSKSFGKFAIMVPEEMCTKPAYSMLQIQIPIFSFFLMLILVVIILLNKLFFSENKQYKYNTINPCIEKKLNGNLVN